MSKRFHSSLLAHLCNILAYILVTQLVERIQKTPNNHYCDCLSELDKILFLNKPSALDIVFRGIKPLP